jgi:hypothetical protein
VSEASVKALLARVEQGAAVGAAAGGVDGQAYGRPARAAGAEASLVLPREPQARAAGGQP